MKICIILLIIALIYAVVFYKQYKPSIDIIKEGDKFRIIMWYYFESKRYYIHLFTL